MRGAIKRLTDAYTWGALGEADYREQLRRLQAQLEHLDTAPDERRMMTAIRVAEDLAATWERARPERRKQLIAELFDTIRVGGGRIVSVKPKAAVMPLVAVTVSDIEGKDWRSRPGLNPPVFASSILVEGVEEVLVLPEAREHSRIRHRRLLLLWPTAGETGEGRLATRRRRGGRSGGRDIHVESEAVFRIVAPLQCREPGEPLGTEGGAYAFDGLVGRRVVHVPGAGQ